MNAVKKIVGFVFLASSLAHGATQQAQLSVPTKQLFHALYSVKDPVIRHTEIHAALVAGAQTHVYNAFGHTALTYAANSSEMHEYIPVIATRENVNIPFKSAGSFYPITLLCRASRDDENLARNLALLIALGADKEACCPITRYTPLGVLCVKSWQSPESIAYLLSQNAHRGRMVHDPLISPETKQLLSKKRELRKSALSNDNTVATLATLKK